MYDFVYYFIIKYNMEIRKILFRFMLYMVFFFFVYTTDKGILDIVCIIFIKVECKKQNTYHISIYKINII